MKRKFQCLAVLVSFAIIGLTGCTQPTAPVSTGTRLFWVDDLSGSNGTWTQISASLKYQSSRCNVYVRHEDTALISQALIDEYGNYFTERSWPDITDYVYRPTEFFGEQGDRINILFYRTRPGLAGYFWSKDFMSNATAEKYGRKSNETNIFYMNIDAAVRAGNQASATLFTKGTLSHEFQHMCNAHYFYFGGGENKEREMDSWANELCSTTSESVFADQYLVYAPSFSSDMDGDDDGRMDFSSGQTDFLYWGNSFTQYTVTALLGGYILSEIDAANRPNLIKVFLEKTHFEDGTPDSYSPANTQASYDNFVTSSYSSVEDLILALQDGRVGYAAKMGASWSAVSSTEPEPDRVAANWSLVMKNFLKALVSLGSSTQSPFAAYLDSVSTGTYSFAGMNLPLADANPSSNKQLSLKMSAFALGRTKVDNIDDTTLSSMSSSGANDAYVLVWNGAIPSYNDMLAETDPLTSGTATFSSGTLLARGVTAGGYDSRPASRSVLDYARSWNRSMGRSFGWKAVRPGYAGSDFGQPSSRPGPIAGSGTASNPSDGASGHLGCAYVRIE